MYITPTEVRQELHLGLEEMTDTEIQEYIDKAWNTYIYPKFREIEEHFYNTDHLKVYFRPLLEVEGIFADGIPLDPSTYTVDLSKGEITLSQEYKHVVVYYMPMIYKYLELYYTAYLILLSYYSTTTDEILINKIETYKKHISDIVQVIEEFPKLASFKDNHRTQYNDFGWY